MKCTRLYDYITFFKKKTTTTHTCDSRVESQIGSVYGGSKPVSDGTMVPASS